MNAISAEKTMTVNEVAEVLGYQPDTIQKKACELGFTKKGVKTFLTEKQVVEIKAKLTPRTYALKCVGNNAITEQEENATIANAISILQRRANEYKKRAEIAEQKQEQLKITLDESKQWYSVKRMQKLNPFKHFDWGLLKAESKNLGFEVKKVFDANYGEVNAYNIAVWQSIYFDTLNYE